MVSIWNLKSQHFVVEKAKNIWFTNRVITGVVCDLWFHNSPNRFSWFLLRKRMVLPRKYCKYSEMALLDKKMLGIIWESVRICDSSWKICYPNHRRTSDPFPIPTSCCATFLPSSADNKIWVQDWRKFQFWKMRRRNWVDRLPQMIVCFVQKTCFHPHNRNKGVNEIRTTLSPL